MIVLEKLVREQFQLTIFQEDGMFSYSFLGNIDETFQAEELPAYTAPQVVFDFEQLSGMTWDGMERWLTFANQFKRVPKLIFKNVSICWWDQWTMATHETTHGSLQSLFIPCYCQDCSEEIEVLLQGEYAIEQAMADTLQQHHSCGKKLIFDAVSKDVFFDQIKRFKSLVP